MTVPCQHPHVCGASYHVAGSDAAFHCRAMNSGAGTSTARTHVPAVSLSAPSPQAEPETYKVSQVTMLESDDYDARHPTVGFIEDHGFDWRLAGEPANLRMSHDPETGLLFLANDADGTKGTIASGVSTDQVVDAIQRTNSRDVESLIPLLEVDE